MFASYRDHMRLEHKVDLVLVKLGALLSNQSILTQKVNAMSVDLAAIKAKEDAALAAIQANTNALGSIKTALDDKDATIADLTQKLNDAIAAGADPVALQAIADEAQAIVDASNNQATAEAALANTKSSGGIVPPGTPIPPVAGAAPTIVSISPTSGRDTGGDTVNVVGTGFLAADSVLIGGVPATGVVVNGPTSLSAVTPPGTGTVDLVVNDANGQASNVASFTYVAAAPPTA